MTQSRRSKLSDDDMASGIDCMPVQYSDQVVCKTCNQCWDMNDMHPPECPVVLTQSRRASLLESAANIAIGYCVAVAAQVVIFPLFGMDVPLGDNLLIGGLFTIVSLVRSYCLRRVFNKLSDRGNQ